VDGDILDWNDGDMDFIDRIWDLPSLVSVSRRISHLRLLIPSPGS
jgi:hypothetical protein